MKRKEEEDDDVEDNEAKIYREHNHVYFYTEIDRNSISKLNILHRPEIKMRQNAVMIYIFYNYVSGSLLNVPL
jgi:hypothetical protein